MYLRGLLTLSGLLMMAAPARGKLFSTQMSNRVVNTQYGPLRGVLVTLPNHRLPVVEAYLGIQYASILGGELRFMPPTSPMETWDIIRVALKFRPVCPQKIPKEEDLRARYPLGRAEHFIRLLPFIELQNEECLNLNIYVPVRVGFAQSIEARCPVENEDVIGAAPTGDAPTLSA